MKKSKMVGVIEAFTTYPDIAVARELADVLRVELCLLLLLFIVPALQNALPPLPPAFGEGTQRIRGKE